MNRKKYLFLMVISLLFTVGCDRIVDDLKGDEMARLEAWLQVNNITVPARPSGLYYINNNPLVEGKSPVDSNYVVYSYSVRNLDDLVYITTDKAEATLNDLYKSTTHYVPTFKLFLSKAQNLAGLTEGLSLMKEGEKARLILPSNLGFGYSGGGVVPKYTSLIYDIEMIKVVEDPEVYERDTLNHYLLLEEYQGFESFGDSLYYKKITDGIANGGVAKDSIVELRYTGRFLDGFVFDTNVESVARENGIYSSSKTYSVFSFTVGSNSNIPGFDLAVKKMREGEKAIFIIPSFNAYGLQGSSQGNTEILPYTTLVFEIELTKVSDKSS